MDCQRASLNSLASVWISMMSVMRGPSKTDAKRQARLNAEDTISSLQDREMALQTELRTLAQTARQAKSAAGNSTLKAVLVKSKGIRQQLTTTTKKKMALQGHLDTLKNSELNEQVLSSVKETSVVLKSMGLDKSLGDMDNMVQDLQEAQSDLNALQEGLSESWNAPDDSEMEQELEMLLNDDYGPAEFLQNTIGKSKSGGNVSTVPATETEDPTRNNSMNDSVAISTQPNTENSNTDQETTKETPSKAVLEPIPEDM